MELTYDAAGFELQLSCHHIVVLGDLNYRITLPTPRVLGCMAAADWGKLLQHDQLSNAMAKDSCRDAWGDRGCHSGYQGYPTVLAPG